MEWRWCRMEGSEGRGGRIEENVGGVVGNLWVAGRKGWGRLGRGCRRLEWAGRLAGIREMGRELKGSVGVSIKGNWCLDMSFRLRFLMSPIFLALWGKTKASLALAAILIIFHRPKHATDCHPSLLVPWSWFILLKGLEWQCDTQTVLQYEMLEVIPKRHNVLLSCSFQFKVNS